MGRFINSTDRPLLAASGQSRPAAVDPLLPLAKGRNRPRADISSRENVYVPIGFNKTTCYACTWRLSAHPLRSYPRRTIRIKCGALAWKTESSCTHCWPNKTGRQLAKSSTKTRKPGCKSPSWHKSLRSLRLSFTFAEPLQAAGRAKQFEFNN